MIDAMMQILLPIIGVLSAKFGVVGMVLAYVVMVGGPLMTVLLELIEFIVQMFDAKDEDKVSKVRAIWNKVLPWLELLPHSNLPISATAIKIIDISKKVFAAIMGAVKGWKNPDDQQPPAPPAPPAA